MKTIKTTILVQSLAASLVLFIGTAHADMHSTKAVSDHSSMQRVVVPGKLVQVGQVDQDAVHKIPLKGFAKDLPLITVLKQVTPNGWIVKKNDTEDNKLDVQMPVSWVGGDNWINTLTKVSQDNFLNTVVNWDDKTITVSRSRVVHVPMDKSKEPVVSHNHINKSAGVFQLESANTKDVTVGASEQKVETHVHQEKAEVVVVKPAPQPQVVQQVQMQPEPVRQEPSWRKDSSKTLKENVAVWATASGYRLVWLGEDYPVDDTVVLKGEFDSEMGPIKQLSEDYGPDSRVDTPLSFQFYQNRTLVVENWAFEQAGNPQYGKKDKQ